MTAAPQSHQVSEPEKLIAALIRDAPVAPEPEVWLAAQAPPPAAKKPVGKRERTGRGKGRKNENGGQAGGATAGDGGDGKDRPEIFLEPGEIEKVIDAGEAALINSGIDIYRYGELLVRPTVQYYPAADQTLTRQHAMNVETPNTLLEAFTTVARWLKYDGRVKGYVAIDCPAKIANIYADRRGRWGVRPLVGILNAPMIRSTGGVLEQPGYDPPTGLIFRPDGVDFGLIPKEPTKEDAFRALAQLKNLLSTFPFVTDADRSVALSAILSVLDRRAVPTTPLHAFSAPTPGSGKSMLVEIATIIATGDKAKPCNQAKDDVETDKVITAELLSGRGIIFLDNCDRPVDSSLLCQALTAEGELQIRPLGVSKNMSVPNRQMWFATGNNFRVVADLTRRVLTCRIDAGCERPELREFAVDAIAKTRKNRVALVRAALTIICAYMVSGDVIHITPFGSYTAWSHRVREALMWLGCTDPCDTIEQGRKNDPLTSTLRSLVGLLYTIFDRQPFGVRQLIVAATQADVGAETVHADLRDTLMMVAGIRGTIDAPRLGRWLARYEGRFVGRWKLTREGDTDGAARWHLVENRDDAGQPIEGTTSPA